MSKPDDVSVAGWEFACREWWLNTFTSELPAMPIVNGHIEARRKTHHHDVECIAGQARAFDAATEELHNLASGGVSHLWMYYENSGQADDERDLKAAQAVLARYTPERSPDAR